MMVLALEFHYKFFTLTSHLLSQLLTQRPALHNLARANLRHLLPSLPAPTIFFLESPTALFFSGCRQGRGELKRSRYHLALGRVVFPTLPTSENLRGEEGVGRQWQIELCSNAWMWLTALTAVFRTPASVVATTEGLTRAEPAYFLTYVKPPLSIPVKSSNNTGCHKAGNSTGATGSL